MVTIGSVWGFLYWFLSFKHLKIEAQKLPDLLPTICVKINKKLQVVQLLEFPIQLSIPLVRSRFTDLCLRREALECGPLLALLLGSVVTRLGC